MHADGRPRVRCGNARVFNQPVGDACLLLLLNVNGKPIWNSVHRDAQCIVVEYCGENDRAGNGRAKSIEK